MHRKQSEHVENVSLVSCNGQKPMCMARKLCTDGIRGIMKCINEKKIAENKMKPSNIVYNLVVNAREKLLRGTFDIVSPCPPGLTPMLSLHSVYKTHRLIHNYFVYPS